MNTSIVQCSIDRKKTNALTTLVALPLLNLECQVKGTNGEVDSLGVNSSHLVDKKRVTYWISKPPPTHCCQERDHTDTSSLPLL